MTYKLIPLDINQLKTSSKGTSGCATRAKKKLAILIRDGFRCFVCKSTERLTIAHTIPIGKRKRTYKIEECITLCVECHNDYENRDMMRSIRPSSVDFKDIRLDEFIKS